MRGRPCRIVISSEVEKSFSFAVFMCVNGSGKLESKDEWLGIGDWEQAVIEIAQLVH